MRRIGCAVCRLVQINEFQMRQVEARKVSKEQTIHQAEFSLAADAPAPSRWPPSWGARELTVLIAIEPGLTASLSSARRYASSTGKLPTSAGAPDVIAWMVAS